MPQVNKIPSYILKEKAYYELGIPDAEEIDRDRRMIITASEQEIPVPEDWDLS